MSERQRTASILAGLLSLTSLGSFPTGCGRAPLASPRYDGSMAYQRSQRINPAKHVRKPHPLQRKEGER